MDNFKLWKKWFWIGIAMGFIDAIAGTIYGIALATEKEYRREGAIIIIWSLLVSVASFYINRGLLQSGELSPYFVPEGAAIKEGQL